MHGQTTEIIVRFQRNLYSCKWGLAVFLILSFVFSIFPLPSPPLRLQVHVPNSCESGTRADVEEPEVDELVTKGPEELKKDPHTCFFENQHHAHGSHWTPSYDRCFSCSCQVKRQNLRARDA